MLSYVVWLQTGNSCLVVPKDSCSVVQCCGMFSNVMQCVLMSCKVLKCEAMSWIVYCCYVMLYNV
jgi:hypothetical protein